MEITNEVTMESESKKQSGDERTSIKVPTAVRDRLTNVSVKQKITQGELIAKLLNQMEENEKVLENEAGETDTFEANESEKIDDLPYGKSMEQLVHQQQRLLERIEIILKNQEFLKKYIRRMFRELCMFTDQDVKDPDFEISELTRADDEIHNKWKYGRRVF